MELVGIVVVVVPSRGSNVVGRVVSFTKFRCDFVVLDILSSGVAFDLGNCETVGGTSGKEGVK